LLIKTLIRKSKHQNQDIANSWKGLRPKKTKTLTEKTIRVFKTL